MSAYASFKDVSENQDIFNLDDANMSDEYKVAYILRTRKGYYLYKSKDDDDLYIKSKYGYEFENDIITSQVKKKKNFLCKNKVDLITNCNIIISAKKTIGVKKYTFKYLNKYNQMESSDLFLKKCMNSWILQNKHFNYMGIIFNDNVYVRGRNNPDKILLVMPTYYEGHVKIPNIPANKKNNIVLSYINNSNDNLKVYKNKEAVWASSVEAYSLRFQFSGGIASSKNSVIINEIDESIIETLKIDQNIMALVYKKPISLIHAFSIGLSKFWRN